MKRILWIVALGLCALGLSAQDWMKADWYMTKKQVIDREGVPSFQDDGTLTFKNKRVGAALAEYSRFRFEDKMLQAVDQTSRTVSFDSVLETLIELNGKPVYQPKDEKVFGWKTKRGWTKLFELEIPGEESSLVAISYYPTDSSSFAVEQIRMAIAEGADRH